MFSFASRNVRVVLPLLLILALPLTAQSRREGARDRRLPGTGNPDEQLPVWSFVEKGVPAPVTTPLAVYWLPASVEEMDHSPLLTARALLEQSVGCVALQVIVPPNAAAAEKLGVAGKLPTAVLVDRQGNVIRRAENVRGVLRPAAVEKIVNDEIGLRNESMYRDIREAKRRADAGEKEAAIRLYTKIWDDRCLFPLAGKEAQTALKALGVVVQEPPAQAPPDPYLATPPTKKPKG